MKTNGKIYVKQLLDKWGFPIISETENSILFRYQMSLIEVTQYGDDESDAIMVILREPFKAEKDVEEAGALHACNHVNRQLLQVKLYLDKDGSLEIASEFFYMPEFDLGYLLLMSLKSVILGRKRFFEIYKAIEEGTNFLTNLEIAKLFGDQ